MYKKRLRLPLDAPSGSPGTTSGFESIQLNIPPIKNNSECLKLLKGYLPRDSVHSFEGTKYEPTFAPFLPSIFAPLFFAQMTSKSFYGYTKGEWVSLVVGYFIFFVFGAVEASEGVYYGLMKTELEIPYNIQGYLVSAGSWSFIIGSPLLGILMSYTDVKPILVGAFVSYFVAYCILYNVSVLWVVFILLFIEGLGGVGLDVGMNTLSTVLFSSHRGVMMSYLHFFYGMGSMVGPEYASIMLSFWDRGYRGIFLGLMIPVVLGVVVTLLSHLSLKEKEPLPAKEGSIKESSVDSADKGAKSALSSSLDSEVQVQAQVQTQDQTQSQTQANNPKAELPSSKADSLSVEIENSPVPAYSHSSVWKSFLSPMVWILGLNMGAVYAIESITVNWGPLYLHDLYGMKIEEEGSRFLSLFYLFYTVTRLGVGFIIDFFGDITSMIGFNVVLIVLYLVAFSLGQKGVWLLAGSGLLISPFYPTSITVPMQVFGENAQNTISVILCIACMVNLLIQVPMGHINNSFGAAWGYRILAIAMCVMMIVCLSIANYSLRRSARKATIRKSNDTRKKEAENEKEEAVKKSEPLAA